MSTAAPELNLSCERQPIPGPAGAGDRALGPRRARGSLPAVEERAQGLAGTPAGGHWPSVSGPAAEEAPREKRWRLSSEGDACIPNFFVPCLCLCFPLGLEDALSAETSPRVGDRFPEKARHPRVKEQTSVHPALQTIFFFFPVSEFIAQPVALAEPLGAPSLLPPAPISSRVSLPGRRSPTPGPSRDTRVFSC